MSKPDDERSTYWYYRIGGREAGPVLMSRLRQLSRKGELAAEDSVRKGKMGEWVDAATIDELNAQPRRMPGKDVQKSSEPAPRDERPSISDLGSSFWTSVRIWRHDSIQAIVERLWLVRRIVSVVALVAITFALFRATVDLKMFDWSSPPDAYTTFNGLWDELKQKRGIKTREEEWREFSERGRLQIEPIVALLETEGSSQNRVAQMLLWAGRDCLPKMFDDARSEPSPSERRFEEYMQNVVALRNNQPIYGGNAGATHWYDQVRARRWWHAIAPGTAALWGGIILADVAIVVWLFRAWRKNKA